MQATALVGIARLVPPAVRGVAPARVLLIAGAAQLGMVAVLPGEAWYYYLDALLPWWALAAGAAFTSYAVGGEEATAPPSERARPRDLGAALVIVAALFLGVAGAAWLRAIARHGYLVLDPAPLTLDHGGGRDAATPGRLVTAGSKRAIAAAVATEPAPFAVRWLATHGPAFDDATGDNGFWLLHAGASAAEPPPAVTHAALWYRDDPGAPAVATPGFELVTSGPLLVVRYRATIRYDLCRDGGGRLTVPMRVVPHPRRYGDGTPARPAALPGRIECAVDAGAGATRVVAAVGAGTVTLHGENGATGASGRESTLCVPRHADRPAPFAVTIALPAGARSDLDLYERPDPACGAEKIAP